MRFNTPSKIAVLLVGLSATSVAVADQVIADDLIVQFSACVGNDCVNGENFGFDTIRLKENNTRIKFDDTSSSGAFPNVDWQLTANDSANGGANKFSIEDITGGRVPFTVEANAPNNTLYADDAGNIGLGTSSPVVNVHAVDGNTPAMRLEQNGSSGFTPQTWDVAGNESVFFVRDVTNGSKLPFKIEPNAATNSLVIDTTGNVGIGTNAPGHKLDVNGGSARVAYNRADFSPTLTVENTSITNTFAGIRLATNAMAIDFNNSSSEWRINFNDGDGQEFGLDAAGNMTITGTLTANGSTFPDYVFDDGYDLMPLDDVEEFIELNGHLPNVPNAEDVAEHGVNMTETQKILMEKVEELTLYTIQQQKMIEELRATVDELKKK